MAKRLRIVKSRPNGSPTSLDAILPAELEAADRRVDGLRAALEQAERRQALLRELAALGKPHQAGSIKVPQESPISDIVAAALLEGSTTKQALNDRAIELGHAAPGRAIHATLMNYVRRGLVTDTGGRFSLTRTGKEALDGEVEGAR